MKGNRHSFKPSSSRRRITSPAFASRATCDASKRALFPKSEIQDKLHPRSRDGNSHSGNVIVGSEALDATSLLSPPHSLLGYRPPEWNRPKLKIVFLGPSIALSWRNDHATTYRGLARELSARGHHVLLLERDARGSAANRDLRDPPHPRTEVYSDVKGLKHEFAAEIREADFVLVCSCVQDGIAIGDWVTGIAHGATAFYDMDTPVTMTNLFKGNEDSISAALIRRYQLYLSFTGGPLLNYIERHYRPPRARPLYCSVDATQYFPEQRPLKWDLGYMGTYSDDCQRALDRLLLEPARRWGEGRFVVAGPHYPRSVRWPRNVNRFARLPPGKHRAFYNSQRFMLNVTGASMIAAGFSPGARLFEAAACGTPIISDFWPGIETFFKPDEEILISHSPDETLIYLEEISELDRRRIGYRARERVLAKHTVRHRAAELENYALEILKLTTA